MSKKRKPSEVKSLEGSEDRSVVATEIAYDETIKNLIREESAMVIGRPKRRLGTTHVDKVELAKLCYIDHI